MTKIKLFLFLIFLSVKMAAQNDPNILTAEQFLQLVRLYHPVVKISNINIEKSKADIQIAKGAFNPLIGNYIANKTFDNTTYYNYINPNINIPTWFGIEVSAGAESLVGNRFDPSETVGQSSYIGVGIPLLKNLVMDKRRAYLKQAKIYNEMAEIEQNIAVNNILMDAITQYWEWQNAFQVLEVVSKNYENSKARFDFVKKSVLNGERPAIDTVEAMSQLQSFEFQKNESTLSFQNEGIELSVFLWQKDNQPYQLPSFVVPSSGEESNMQNIDLNVVELQNTARQFHPELKIYAQKSDFLAIDKKLKFQELLPKLDFRYNHLAKGYNMFEPKGLLFQNNYQYGLKFEMPLFFSQGRGEYKKAKLKIEENQINLSQKQQIIDLKIKKYFNEYQMLKNQIALQNDILNNLQKLLKAEESLFKNGESTMFLINSRENKVLDTERKLIELKTKYFKTIYALRWSTGRLP